MRNEFVEGAISGEIKVLSEIIKKNPGCYMEVNRRDGNEWILFKEKPDWSVAPEDVDGCNAYVDNLKLATSSQFDFPGVSGLNAIDPVLYEAMAIALGITLAPEE